MKRLLLVSDVTRGGAAADCRRLLAGLARQNRHEAAWVSASGMPGQGAVCASEWPSIAALSSFRVRARCARGGTAALRRATVSFNERNVLRLVKKRSPDLISLHNVHDGMSFRFVERVAEQAPIVWTLHDMWAVTGYCCYSFECRKYESGCTGACPQMGNWGPSLGKVADGWERRRRLLQKYRSRIRLVTPSRWLQALVARGFSGIAEAVCIPYGVDTDVFCPITDRGTVRRCLGLPAEGALLLAGAQSTTDERKGTRLLLEAVERLRATSRTDITLALFGAVDPETAPQGVVNIGVVREESLLNLYYGAADAFVLPSLADNLPNTLIEATAAGTPCVTFGVGGCPEVVRDGETGFVAEARSVEALTEGIGRVLALSTGEQEGMRTNCRAVAEREYTIALQARRYADLFDAVLDSNQ